ncbi:MAG: 4-hydroxy-tetrahydrodipicolinate reductase [Candidatus Melainabacteria bacterium GWF2_37_15]|nr:MAG: 4-hydroxy-tetrahydrodipicolinate reductase [Candidatus Melainabacteria bacterium GWF2_37_15]
MTQKIKVAVSGACGKMGQAVINAVLQENDLELVSAIDVMNVGQQTGGVTIEESLEKALLSKQIDVIIDFTNPELVFKHTKLILEKGARPVIGTTGLTESQIEELKKLSQEKGFGCLIAPNFALGAVLMMMFAQQASKYLSNAEIIEFHHNKKKDAPSGTAIKTAQLMTQERAKFSQDNCLEIETIQGSRGGVTESNIHIHSVRLPGFVAHQEVIFGAPGQALTIRHDSFDRISFMPGVILSIRHIMKNNDFVYGLENIL